MSTASPIDTHFLYGVFLSFSANNWSTRTANPSKLTAEDRTEYGIHERMPQDLETSLNCLGKDTELTSLLGEKLVEDYKTVKRAEREMLGNMGEEERRLWIIERY